MSIRTRPPPEPLLSTSAAADMLAISLRSVYRLMASGELATVRVGGRTLIEPAELRRYISQHRRRTRPV